MVNTTQTTTIASRGYPQGTSLEVTYERPNPEDSMNADSENLETSRFSSTLESHI